MPNWLLVINSLHYLLPEELVEPFEKGWEEIEKEDNFASAQRLLYKFNNKFYKYLIHSKKFKFKIMD